MKKLFYIAIVVFSLGCQSESLDIRAPYRIKLQVESPPPSREIQMQSTYTLRLELLTDSYYSQFGYQLQFYQESGLGRIARKLAPDQDQPVLQKVPVALPLGRSEWHYTPEAAGPTQLVLVAQQERGYTQPDTIRLNFNVQP